MGFPKVKATSILSDVFKANNTIALLTAVDTTNDTYTEASGTGYQRYTIKSGDFTVNSGVATTAQHILFGLAESNWGTIAGIAVFSGSTLQYLGELTPAKEVGANTVPVFKKYADGEGIRVTLDVVTTAAVDVTGTTHSEELITAKHHPIGWCNKKWR